MNALKEAEGAGKGSAKGGKPKGKGAKEEVWCNKKNVDSMFYWLEICIKLHNVNWLALDYELNLYKKNHVKLC
jgi:hypothetical protein